MADSGYSDGSVVVSTDLDTQGFEAGSDRMKNAIDSSMGEFQKLGDTLQDAMNQGVQAVQESAPLIDKALTDSVNSFQTSSEDIQSWIGKWADAIPEKKFEASISAIQKMLDGLEGKMQDVSQSYTKAGDGGAKEISKFETQARAAENGLNKLDAEIEKLYGTAVRSKGGTIFSGRESDDLRMLITRCADLQEQLQRMQTAVIKVKAETEKAKAAETAAIAKAKAETEAARSSTRKLADENKKAWQTVKQEIKGAETETKAFDSTYKSIGNSIRTLENKIDGLAPAAKKAMGGSESAVDSFEFKVANTQRQIQYLRERLETLGSARINSEEYNTLVQGIEAARTKLNDLLAAKQKMLAEGKDQTSEEWKNTESAIAAAQAQLQRFEASKAAMESAGTATVSGTDTTAYQEAANQIQQLEQRVTEYESKVSKANGRTRLLMATLKGMARVGVTTFKLLGKSIAAATGKMRTFGKSSNGSMQAVKKLTKVFTSFGTRIKSMLKRRFISALFSGAVDGIKNLAQVSPELNASMSAMMTALAQLKNSFASAFAPIITVVSPVLVTLINLLSDAFTKVGMLISALTGATSFKKAVTVQKDYAASLKDTSKAADKASKSVAGFDELNNTTTSDSSNSSDTATNPADMFETVPIDSKIKSIADKIKNAFKNGDFEGIGEAIANKFNSVVQKINSAISWDNVGPKITAFADGLTRTFNSIVDNVNWALIGDTVAQGVNTLVNTLYLLVTGINWGNLGKSLMDGLNGLIYGVNWNKLGKTIGTMFQSALSFLNNVVHTFNFKALAKGIGGAVNNAISSVNWGMLGETLSTGIRNAFQFVSETIKSIDFNAIGENIAKFINNIDAAGILGDLASMLSNILSGALNIATGLIKTLDWGKLGSGIWSALGNILTGIDWGGLITKAFELLGAAVAGAVSLLGSFFLTLWEGVKTAWFAVEGYFSEQIKEAGGNIWAGVLEGITEGLASIGSWIVTNIFDPFINGFKAAFGIHSPSTVMAEMGGYLIAGLLNGINSAWGAVKSFFTNAWSTIKSVCTNAWNSIKSACVNAWNSVTSKIKESAAQIKDAISDKFNAAKDAVVEKVTQIKQKVTEGFTNAWSTINSKMSSIKSTISTGFSNVYSTVSTKISSIKSNISSGFNSMKSSVSSAVSGIWSSVSNTFSSLVSNAWTWGADICENMANGIRNMAGSVWDSVSGLAGDIRDYLGFSEPEKGPLSNFHTYMPDMLELMAEGINKNKHIALDAVSDLAQGISDEAQDTSVLIPIDADNKYTNFLDNFTDKITDAFSDMISRLEAIAGNVTFSIPAVAEGSVIPYKLAQSGEYSDNGGSDSKSIDIDAITDRIDRVVNSLNEVVDAIDNKEMGVTDEAIYSSVKKSVRKEQKSTGRNPFGS